MKPTLGRIVIFNNKVEGQEPVQHAAIITHVWNDTCINLKAFGKDHNNTDIIVTSCTQGDGDNQWNWPKREE
jgi:hypothetical protein